MRNYNKYMEHLSGELWYCMLVGILTRWGFVAHSVFFFFCTMLTCVFGFILCFFSYHVLEWSLLNANYQLSQIPRSSMNTALNISAFFLLWGLCCWTSSLVMESCVTTGPKKKKRTTQPENTEKLHPTAAARWSQTLKCKFWICNIYFIILFFLQVGISCVMADFEQNKVIKYAFFHPWINPGG